MTSFLVKRFIKDHDKTYDNAVRGRYANLSCIVGMICNLLLFAAKLFIGMISSSMAVTADAFNNLSDMGSSLVVLLGFKLAEKPADKEHPFGHGRMEYVSGFVVAVLIILVGVELLKSSVGKIFSPAEVSGGAAVIIGLALSACLKLWMFFFNRKMGSTIDSEALKAASMDSIVDCIATSAVIIAFAVSAFTGVNIDPYVGVAVALFIIYSGINTAKDTMDPLLGMPPSDEFTNELKSRILEYDGFVGVHDLIVHNYGPGRVFASVHVEVPENINIVKCHEQIDRCEKEIGADMKLLLVIHMDPIATENEEINRVKHEMEIHLRELDDRYSIHDFRMVMGENQTNLIFDLVLPSGSRVDTSEMDKKINAVAKSMDSTYNCVVTYDISLS